MQHPKNTQLSDLRKQYIATTQVEKKDSIARKYKSLLNQSNLTEKDIVWYYLTICDFYDQLGDYKRAIFIAKEGLEFYKQHKIEPKSSVVLLNFLTQYYANLRNCDSSLHFSHKSVLLSTEINEKKDFAFYNAAQAYRQCNQLEQYKKYLRETIIITRDSSLKAASWQGLADYYVEKKNPDSVLIYGGMAGEYFKKLNETIPYTENLINISSAYFSKKQYQECIRLLNIAIPTLEKKNRVFPEEYILKGHAFLALDKYDSAHYNFMRALKRCHEQGLSKTKLDVFLALRTFYQKTKQQKEELVIADSLIQLSQNTLTEELVEVQASLEKDFRLKQKDLNIQLLLKDAILSKNKIDIRNIFIVSGTVFFLLMGFLAHSYYQNRLIKREQQKILLEQRLLLSQMSPHFIFNALSSLQNEIISGNIRQANLYLTKYAALTRQILENSTQERISVEDEIEMLHSYLLLQRARYGDRFDYQVNIYKDYEKEYIEIPPMIIQPFVENAIEHGFSAINYKGLLIIDISKQQDELQITISDNGRGLQNKELNKTKESLSIELIKQRLKLLYKKSSVCLISNAELRNNMDSGVTVLLTIPIRIK